MNTTSNTPFFVTKTAQKCYNNNINILNNLKVSLSNLSTSIVYPSLCYVNNTIYKTYETNTIIELQVLLEEEQKYQNVTKIKSPNYITIPKKLHKTINYLDKELLLKINKDINVAKELCLYFLSFMSPSHFKEDKMIPLSSKILMNVFGESNRKLIYTIIREALLKGTEKGSIILINNGYVKGEKCKTYGYTDLYQCGLQQYELKTNFVIKLKEKFYYEGLAKAIENPIAKNLLSFYSLITLQSSKELLNKGKELVKNNYVTKKKKKLTMLHRQNKSHWKDIDKRSFVEENIELYEYLTDNGLLMPIIGDERSGGRVYDSISLMSSWIRNEIKIDNEDLVELDYKCLHPNLIAKIYGGNYKYMTHERIAKETGLDKSTIKIEHLSFFNKEWSQMEKSPLFDWYYNNHRKMMQEIYIDKKIFGHKITSKKLFALEVEIMTNVIGILNQNKVYVGYGYDALFTNETNKYFVETTMNNVIEQMGIYTATYDKNITLEESKIEEQVNTLEVKESVTEEVLIADKETYEIIFKDNFPNTINKSWFKINERKIYDELITKQIKGKRNIIEIIKQYN